MRAGVLDLGSTTFHALVADVDGYGVRRVVFERGTVVRLGDHLDGGDVSELIQQRCIHAIQELVTSSQLRALAPVRVVATGALRDTDSGRRLVATAAARLGLAIDVLAGHEEARLTWLGVSTELAGSHGRLAVLDLGGGSLELAAGDEVPVYTSSMPLGVLRMRKLSTTMLRDAVEQATASAVRELTELDIQTVALSSGTARALLRVARKLGIVAEHQRHVAAGAFLELARRLPQLSQATLLDLGVSRARLDTIGAGAAIYATVLAALGRPLVYVARSALREGLLVDQARRLGNARLSVPAIATA